MTLSSVTNQRERDKFKEVGTQTTTAVSIFDSSGDQINIAKETGGNLASIKTNTDNLTSDPATESKQLPNNHQVTVSNPTTNPETGLAKSANQQTPSTTPTVYNVTLTNVNTEYSQALPANTREFRFRCRTLFDVRYAWVTGKVATPTAPYLTLPAGSDYWSDWNNLSDKTLYFASSTAGVIIELEIFTA